MNERIGGGYLQGQYWLSDRLVERRRLQYGGAVFTVIAQELGFSSLPDGLQNYLLQIKAIEASSSSMMLDSNIDYSVLIQFKDSDVLNVITGYRPPSPPFNFPIEALEFGQISCRPTSLIKIQ